MVPAFGKYLKKIFDLLVWWTAGEVLSQETYSPPHSPSIIKTQKSAGNTTKGLDIIIFSLLSGFSGHALTNAGLKNEPSPL